ncbi:coiled-coil domain-containing protein 137-like isoform X2 [Elysia marginata]|uniref:Coiled-coil domain-containing protein 137-like isoform X2 n=1 Tax=Elysia marginata TaxID=1093978 RepID=A0AAV4IGR0_9GAST|nr:coiled-coil domain-containing protein 137-like isoform X2 [Elysia marginata]
MGKLAKPQRSKKHKKIKSLDPSYGGNRKDNRTEGLNQKPRDYNQEVPKKLRNLGFSIGGVREGKVGKKSKNKFHKHPDGPNTNPTLLPRTSNFKLSKSSQKSETEKLSNIPKKEKNKFQEAKNGKKDKKGIKSKVSDEVFNDYVDNLKPARPFVESFNFKKKQDETEKQFNRRVEDYASRALAKSKIDDHFDVSDEKKMMQKMMKIKKGMSEKKKQRLKEKKGKKADAVKEKKLEKLQGFEALKDKVEFGETVHAPPVLSVRPKKAAVLEDVDRVS